jgi:lipopolysaccharide export system protein LptA
MRHSKIHAPMLLGPGLRALLTCVAMTSAALLPGQAARAEQADRNRPMNIEADRLDHDDSKKLSVFQGHVVANKGTIVFRGDTLQVREDEKGYQHGLLLPLQGQRAFYRQKREGVAEFMEGEAERIEYDGQKDRVTLSGRAELRRLRGNTLSDEIQGQVIVYDNLNDQFTVDGVPRGTAPAPGTPRSRVRAVLAPKSADGAPR